MPLRYASGQLDTQRSNTPVGARNSAKNNNYRRVFVPAHVHAPAQRVHHLSRRFITRPCLSPFTRCQRLASCFTHRVSVPNLSKPAPLLANQVVEIGNCRI